MLCVLVCFVFIRAVTLQQFKLNTTKLRFKAALALPHAAMFWGRKVTGQDHKVKISFG